MMKKIGVLTSGGDAPGMNAAVRAVVRNAVCKDIEVVGIEHGYDGLIKGLMHPMDVRTVSNTINKGGTLLYTARSPEFHSEPGVAKAARSCKEHGIEGLVVVGGDGSFRGARDLSRHGIACVGIPGTIDNDIACSDYTIGFDTAMNTCIELVDKLRDTCQSHDRCNIVEVMGRRAGYIALNVGIAVGATGVLIPEIPYDLETDVLDRIRRTSATGKHHFIFVVAEGVGCTQDLVKIIEERTHFEARATVLGHVQRGGTPTLRDRVLASEMGYHAVNLLAEGAYNRVVAYKNDRIVDYDIEEALEMKKTIDPALYQMAKDLSI